jgi:hypothetical protein
MNTAFDVLVISLGCLLGIFLILSIAAVIVVLRLVASLRAIVAKGEQLVDSAEAISETLREHAGAVSVVKLLVQLVGRSKRKRG